MDIKPNLENLSDEEYLKLIYKILGNLEDEINNLPEDLDSSFDQNISKPLERLRNKIAYYQNHIKLRNFYRKYDVDYRSRLN